MHPRPEQSATQTPVAAAAVAATAPATRAFPVTPHLDEKRHLRYPEHFRNAKEFHTKALEFHNKLGIDTRLVTRENQILSQEAFAAAYRDPDHTICRIMKVRLPSE